MELKEVIHTPSARLIRQGDVLLKPIASIPKEAILVERGAKILQKSEVTGHHHQFLPTAKVDLYKVTPELIPGIATITDNEGKLIFVTEPSYLFHGKLFEKEPAKTKTGDHDAILVPPGAYVVDIVREYDYQYHETSRVQD
jgi:hypothetical protein